MSDKNINDVINRVTELVNEFESSTKRAQAKLNTNKKTSNKRAELKPELEEYDAGKHEKPSEGELPPVWDQILSESYSIEDEEATEHTEADLKETMTEDVSSAGEDKKPAKEYGDEDGQSVDSKLASISDERLFNMYNRKFNELCAYIAANDGEAVKKAGIKLDNDTEAAVVVSRLIKQAELDADIVTGFAVGLSEQVQNAQNAQEFYKQAAADPDFVKVASLIDNFTNVLAAKEASGKQITQQDIQDAVSSIIGACGQDSVKKACYKIAQMLPDEEAAAMLADAGGGQDPIENLAATLEQMGATPEEVQEAVQEIMAELGAEGATMADVPGAGPEDGAGIDAVLQALATEGSETVEDTGDMEDETSEEDGTESVTEETGTEETEEDYSESENEDEEDDSSESEETDSEEFLPEPTEKVIAANAKKRQKGKVSKTAKNKEASKRNNKQNDKERISKKEAYWRGISAMSDALEEFEISPKELVEITKDTSRYGEAVKVARAVDQYRKKNQKDYKVSKASPKDNKLAARVKDYLYDLLSDF